MKTRSIREIPDTWVEKVKEYTERRGLGNDYIFADWYSLGGGYVLIREGYYSLYIFNLYGRFSPDKKKEYLTLFCIMTQTHSDNNPDTEYTYLFDFLHASIFSSVFDLKRVYNYVQRKRYATFLGGTITEAQWEVIKAHYDYVCLCCGRKEPDITLTIDHIVPRSKGGTSILSNIQPLCRPCNSAKGDKIIDYRRTYQSLALVV